MIAADGALPAHEAPADGRRGISRVGAIAGGALLLIASVLICIDITLRYRFLDARAAPTSCRAMRWPSPAPGASPRPCSAARTSASTRSTCACRPIACGRCSISSASARSLCFFALVTWYAWGVVWQSWRVGLALAVGASRRRWSSRRACGSPAWLFFVAVSLLLLVRGLLAFMRRRPATALFALIGSKSARGRGRGGDRRGRRTAFEQEKKQ